MNKNMDSMPVIKDFRPFIICTPENYEISKAFYSAMGFKKLWDDEKSACEFTTGFNHQRFLVTLHYGLELVRNAMMHCWVDDSQAWYDYLESLDLNDQFPMIKITPPVVTEWGWSITYVACPAGIKWHFAEPHSESNKKFFNSASWMK